jgi:hypothetical protein
MKPALSPCCGKPLIFSKLETHYKEQSQFLVTEKQVCCYQYTCPHCKTYLEFNKDFIREEWSKSNPNKNFIRKL